MNINKIIDVMARAINDLNALKSDGTASINYVVVKLDHSSRGVETIKRKSFDSVEDAILYHKEKEKEYSESTYWDLVVEYT